MSPDIIDAESRRVTARVVLFIVVAVVTTLVLFSGGPKGPWVFAQQTSPVTSIKWVNPDDGQSTEISAKPDGSTGPTANAYHLVAWVGLAPSNATVSFSYRSGTGTPTPICSAVAVGDTYHCDWTGPSMPPDGTYNLVATLSSGGATPAATDTEEIVVNNADDDPPDGLDPTTDQAETVEISEPDIGDTLAFTDGPEDVGMVATIQVTHSADVTELTPYYTTSSVGTDPEWIECEGGAEESGDAADGIECELAAGTSGTQVTGIAVVANDNPGDPVPVTADVESGDAHRVIGSGVTPGPSSSSPSPTASTTSPSPTASTTSPSPTASSTSPSPTPTETTPPPPIAYSTTTKFKINGNTFSGSVRSDNRKCRKGRKVVFKEERRGKDKRVGQDTTNKRGKFRHKERGAEGKYYAVAKAKGFTDRSGRNVTCGQDRSRTKKA